MKKMERKRKRENKDRERERERERETWGGESGFKCWEARGPALVIFFFT